MDEHSRWLQAFCGAQTLVRVHRCHRHRASSTWRIDQRMVDDHIFYWRHQCGRLAAHVDGRRNVDGWQVAWVSPVRLSCQRGGGGERGCPAVLCPSPQHIADD